MLPSGDTLTGEQCRRTAGKPLAFVGRSDFPASYIMYAIAPTPSVVYHIASGHRTLCRLFVVGDLRLVTEKPKDRMLCKKCEREITSSSETQRPS